MFGEGRKLTVAAASGKVGKIRACGGHGASNLNGAGRA
jgi:hypothetical protein